MVGAKTDAINSIHVHADKLMAVNSITREETDGGFGASLGRRVAASDPSSEVARGGLVAARPGRRRAGRNGRGRRGAGAWQGRLAGSASGTCGRGSWRRLGTAGGAWSGGDGWALGLASWAQAGVTAQGLGVADGRARMAGFWRGGLVLGAARGRCEAALAATRWEAGERRREVGDRVGPTGCEREGGEEEKVEERERWPGGGGG
jgi:hypothetical protein